MIRGSQYFWDVPEMWEGADAVIIGGGPSLRGYDWTRFKDLKKEKGFKIIGVNEAFKLGSFVDICFFGDDWFWLNRRESLKSFTGLCVNLIPKNEEAEKRPLWVKMLRRDSEMPYGLSNIRRQGRDTIAFNGNSGTAAINLAALLGSKKIILLGFDMDVAREGTKVVHNFHDGYPRESSAEVYSHWLSDWAKHMIRDIKKRKIEVIAIKPSKLIDIGIPGAEDLESAL